MKCLNLKIYLTCILILFSLHLYGNDASGQLSEKILNSLKSKKGLCVQVGVQNGALVAALAKNSEMYVQGCSNDLKIVASARENLLKEGVLESSSIIYKEKKGLPYTDNLINLLVSNSWGENNTGDISVKEIIRVLCPGGIAFIGNSKKINAIDSLKLTLKSLPVKVENFSISGWIKVTKNIDPKLGSWTQFKGGADQSYVSNDEVVGPWKEIKWIADPRWGALYTSYMGFVSAGGKVYYKERRKHKNGSQALLIARDAYNGMELWRMQSGPSFGKISRAMDKTLCCDEEQVYVIEQDSDHAKFLKGGQTLVARNGLTGKITQKYKFSFHPEIVTVSGDSLIASARNICGAIDKNTGKPLWNRKSSFAHPPSNGKVVVITTPGLLEGLDLKTGNTMWKTKSSYIPLKLASAQILNVSIKNQTVYVTLKPKYSKPNSSFIYGFDVNSGKELWKHVGGYSHGVLPYDNEVWLMSRIKETKKMSPMNVKILDSKSGKEKKNMRIEGNVFAKCWPARGAKEYIMYGNGWYLNKKKGIGEGVKSTKSPCQIGQHPANGLTYYLPHHCDCSVTLRGFLALSKHDTKNWLAIKGDYSYSTGLKSKGAIDKSSDWPMYRNSGVRGNATITPVGDLIKESWSVKLSKKMLTQATIAYGNIYIGAQNAHQVICLDANTGKEKWSFISDGRVEFAPSLMKGICIFGTNAGTLFGLDALSGNLLWKYRAAPVQKFIGDREKLDSPWPIVGGVLVYNDHAYFSAGRSSSQSGGLSMHSVDIKTGKVKWKGKGGTSGDMFLTAGDFLRHSAKGFEFKTGEFNYRYKKPKARILFTTRYLTTVSIVDFMATLEPNLSYKKHIELTDGRIRGNCISFNEEFVVAGSRYTPGIKDWKKKENTNKYFVHSSGSSKWHKHDTQQQMLALVIAGNNTFGTGFPISRDPSKNSELWVMSNKDGETLQTISLNHRPIYDGLSSANGKLYLACDDGQLICFQKK
ncbi:MAG: hypothetical protein COA79_05600 [Planctomycetota bacterium]|nr:MAG: hypothetical protein COA79_05600 [Planctomycetota bacterium]